MRFFPSAFEKKRVSKKQVFLCAVSRSLSPSPGAASPTPSPSLLRRNQQTNEDSFMVRFSFLNTLFSSLCGG